MENEIENSSLPQQIETEGLTVRTQNASGFNEKVVESGLLISFLRRHFKFDAKLIKEINEAYTHLKVLPLFKIIKILIDTNRILNEREKNNILSYFLYFPN